MTSVGVVKSQRSQVSSQSIELLNRNVFSCHLKMDIDNDDKALSNEFSVDEHCYCIADIVDFCCAVHGQYSFNALSLVSDKNGISFK